MRKELEYISVAIDEMSKEKVSVVFRFHLICMNSLCLLSNHLNYHQL